MIAVVILSPNASQAISAFLLTSSSILIGVTSDLNTARFLRLYSPEANLPQLVAKSEEEDEKINLPQLVADLNMEDLLAVPWGHQILIIDRCKDDSGKG